MIIQIIVVILTAIMDDMWKQPILILSSPKSVDFDGIKILTRQLEKCIN